MRRISRADYLEFLFQTTIDECAQAARDGEIGRPLRLYHEVPWDEGTIGVYLRALYLPDHVRSHEPLWIVRS